MSVKSSSDLIFRHVPSSGGFDKMWRLCDTCSSLVRILTRVPTTKHAWCDMALTGLGLWAAAHYSLLVALLCWALCPFLTCFWALLFGLCILGSVHLINS